MVPSAESTNVIGPISDPTVEPVSQQPLSLQKALSAHDEEPCTALPFLSNEPWEELDTVVEEVTQPPWAGMRAAACMIEVYPAESAQRFLSWIVDEKKKGLAYLLASNIDKIPLQQALGLITPALNGPHAEGCKKRFLDAKTEAIRNAIP